MSAYERKYELKDRDYVNASNFQGPRVSREPLELLLLFMSAHTHTRTHAHFHSHLSLSCLSLCLIILLYPFLSLLHYWHFKQLTREHEACWQ